ncbi:MAG: 2-C-methyl-D-erythritol 4-phosphate cytidylyltransferase [Armatimonadota bacterium]
MGARLGGAVRKAWVPLAGRPLVSYALEAFRSHPAVTEIILVVSAEEIERAQQLIANGPSAVTEKVVLGGAERRDSVWQGLQEVSAGADIVLIHDAARPFISHQVVTRCIEAIRRYGAVVVARPVADTLKRATAEGSVAATVDRAALWGAQTPQGARTGLLLAAYQRAMAEEWTATDDAAILEHAGHRVHLVEGEPLNFKITLPEDLLMAERLLAGTCRSGFGYDVHRLVPERTLVLGGVTLPYALGLLGHSDADVLTHAIMDALLGAAALGDIGQHFPDTDDRYRGVSSLILLGEVAAKLAAAGYHPVNVDATLVAQAPKVAPHIPEMRTRLAGALGIPVEQVSVKATTTEGLGFAGTGEGMAAYATASVAACTPPLD